MSSLVGVTVLALVLFAGETRATPVDIKTEIPQTETQTTQPPASVPSPSVSQKRVVNQNPARETAPAVSPVGEQVRSLQNLQSRVSALETKVKENQNNRRMANWFPWWWQAGFWSGILWMFLWVFVGTQWSRRKFWGFSFPWPWWFWIPVFWFIPWFIIAWWWWLDWWDWWVWIWWLFPWVFWLFWWIVLFKESTLWVWKRK